MNGRGEFINLVTYILFVGVFLVLGACVHSVRSFDNHIEEPESFHSEISKCSQNVESTHQESISGKENVDTTLQRDDSQAPNKEIDEISEDYRTVPSIWPVVDNQSYISSWFGSLRSNGGRSGSFHKGIDIIVPSGTRVIATADGTVRYANRMSGYGNMIIIEHQDGFYSVYGHLSSILVKEGHLVKQGDVIGYSGATGRVTTPHLHYEVRRGKSPINPVWFLPATD